MIRARTTITYPFGTSIHPLPTRQGGAVLLVSLIMLTILTLLGVTAMTTTSLEEKMAANIQ
ncbi:MAG: hypothetical protein GY731_10855, partial [Gammaproteobacteria bacterium]|nr:hypothetical protein [Gammaproteobacteria bacterium]